MRIIRILYSAVIINRNADASRGTLGAILVLRLSNIGAIDQLCAALFQNFFLALFYIKVEVTLKTFEQGSVRCIC